MTTISSASRTHRYPSPASGKPHRLHRTLFSTDDDLPGPEGHSLGRALTSSSIRHRVAVPGAITLCGQSPPSHLPPGVFLRGELMLTLITAQDPPTTAPDTRAGLRSTRDAPARQPTVNILRHTTGCHTFLLSNFKYCLTLFSKFFSSFPHGTCSLSVSCQYLALDEVYHPFRAAIPNNSTLGKRIVRGGTPSHRRGSHPL